MFLQNERGLGVQNGSLGTVETVTIDRIAVMLDDGRHAAFDVKEYAQLDHGYAATVHKSQGVTVDRVHVLATPGLDRHAAYVPLSRHCDSVDLHYGRDDFADQDKLVRTLSRERTKDIAFDYGREPSASPDRGFADRRERRLPPPVTEIVKPAPTRARDPFAGLDLRAAKPAPARGMFDGLSLPSQPPVQAVEPAGLNNDVQRYGRATADIMRIRKGGYTELPHQRIAVDKARDAPSAVRPEAARDLRSAFVRDTGWSTRRRRGARRPRSARWCSRPN